MVLRYSHSLFTGRCVGYNNLKLYLLFWVYATIACLLQVFVLLQNFYYTNALNDTDGLRSFMHIFTHKFSFANLWWGHPLALVDDILISAAWAFGIYSMFQTFEIASFVLLDTVPTEQKLFFFRQPRRRLTRRASEALDIVFGHDFSQVWCPTRPKRHRLL